MARVDDLYFQGHADCINQNYETCVERQATERGHCMGSGRWRLSPVLALIDTGAELCLVKKCLIPKRFIPTSKVSFAPDWCKGG